MFSSRRSCCSLGFLAIVVAACSGAVEAQAPIEQLVSSRFAATSCEGLKSLALPGTTITVAELVSAGPPPRQPGSAPPRALVSSEGVPVAFPPFGAPGYYPFERPFVVAAHCRVVAVLRPSADSEIGMEVWMPFENWNGKFQMLGNGGWAGGISYGTMPRSLNEGYATASTDTGHKGGTGEFALGHPEQVIDFGYRAVHETAVTSKAIISAFYERAPRLSYWNGCSTGGRQGLMEAQRYPEDFDGIIAGAPANNTTHLAAWRIAVEAKVLKEPASVVPPDKLALVNRAVLAACDALDGVTDEFLTDPRQCHFDPSTLLCRVGDGDGCLTAPQVEAVKMGYAPATTKSGELIYPGLVPGAESRWVMLTGATPVPGRLNDLDVFRYLVHEDPAWDWRTFDLARDTALADAKVGYMNASNPDLSVFKARGGKLIVYHGWNDGGNGGAISPLNSVNYYASVLASMGPQQDDWLRLFMVPGMAHCGGGPGAHEVNWVAALERWRESGIAPDQLTGSRVNIDPRVDMTRPVCPYPKVATYNGVGSTNDEASFVCQAP